MARTTRGRMSIFSLAATALVFTAVGCGPDAKDRKIEDLTAENNSLKDELDDRDRRLNDALVKENEARSSIDELNQQLAKSRADGAKGGPDGWITMKNFDMISIPGSVLFESGKADLTPAGRGKLQQIASDIRAKYPDRDIYVFGHTDDQPIRKSKWKDNWELGAHRSLTVIRSLRDNGIANEYLVQANCGEHRPRVANSGDKNRLQNRRVEFYAVPRRTGEIVDRTALGAGDE
jgi:flagellar motor protein MotB